MSGPVETRRIFWIVRLLVAITLSTLLVMIGLVGWQVSSIHAERAKLQAKQADLRDKSEQVQQLTANARLETLAILDESLVLVDKGSTEVLVNAVERLLTGSTPDELAPNVLKQLNTQIHNMAMVKRQALAWRAKYDAVWQDVCEQRSMNHTRELITALREMVEMREGREHLKQAKRIKLWRIASTDAAPLLAQSILSEQYNRSGAGADTIDLDFAELSGLVEQLSGEEQLDNLANLKDNKFVFVLNRIGSAIPSFLKLPAEESGKAQEMIEKLHTAIFGTGYSIDIAHQNVLIGTGGLYALRRETLMLRLEREKLGNRRVHIANGIQAAVATFMHSAHTQSEALESQMDQRLSSNWWQILFLGMGGSAAFLWLAWSISRAIHIQVGALENAKLNAQRLLLNLRKLQRDHMSILNSIGEGIHQIDCNGKIVFENPAAIRLLGWSSEEMIGRHGHSTVHHTRPDGSEFPAAECPIYDTAHTGVAHRVENEVFWRKDGSSFPVEYTTAPVFGEMGEITGAVVVFADITERKKAEKELFRSREMLRSILDNIPQRVFWKDRNSIYLGCNRSFALDMGFDDPNAVPGKSDFDAVRKVSADLFRADDRSIMEKDAPRLSYEEQMEKGDGEKQWLRTSKVPLHDADGHVFGVLGTYEDITASKTAEIVLRESEEKFRQLAERITDVFWISSESKEEFNYVSPAYAVVWGRSPDDLIANKHKWTDAVLPEDRERVLAAFRGLDAHKPNMSVEYRIARPDGTVRWIYDRGYQVHDAAGKVVRTTGIASDITERKRAEVDLARYRDGLELTVQERTRELERKNQLLAEEIAERKRTEESLRKLSQAVENSPAMVIVTGLDGKIEYVNPAFVKTTGYTVEEAVGQNPSLLKSNIHSAQFYKEMWATIHSGATWHGEFYNKRKNGQLYWQSASIASIRGEQGGITHFVSVMEDVTERKLNADELQKAKDAADAANIAKSLFLANMSHEIRTPMNGIIGMNYLMKQTSMSLKQSEYVSKIDIAANNLLGIINDILDFSKVEAGKLTFERIEFNLDEVLSHLVQLTSLQAQKKSLEFKISFAANTPRILIGDPMRLGQVLLNLASNAIKFTAQGSVEIAVCPLKSDGPRDIALQFDIRDTGIGIAPEHIGRLFEPFSQSNSSTTRRFGGTGLGLAISRRFVQIMGGDIIIESRLGAGSTFRFVAHFGCSRMADRSNARLLPVEACKSVLLVDGDEQSRNKTADILRDFSFDIVPMATRELAVLEIKRLYKSLAKTFDLILLDCSAPGSHWQKDGIEIRLECDPVPMPPLILLAPSELGDQHIDVKNFGFENVLIKPITRSALFDAIMNAGQQKPMRKSVTQPRTDTALRGARILLVEDNEINQEIAAEILRMAGCEVSVAADGSLALAMLRDTGADAPFAAVLMDIQMPGMDGYETTLAIRTHAEFDKLPIIAMTADAIAGIKERCIEAGMNDYLTKPINPDEVYATLAEWIDKSTGNMVPTL